MGIALAGFAFMRTSVVNNLPALITKLCNSSAKSIPQPNLQEFDIRHHGDVMVQIFDDACFIFNHYLTWDYLEHQEKDVSVLHQILGYPDEIIAFCHYESGDSYGYAFIEKGKRTRTRLQTMNNPKHPAVIMESGKPKEFEKKWFSAKFYREEDSVPFAQRPKIYYQGKREIEVPEGLITARLLYEAMQKYFSVCPWDTDRKPKNYYFKLSS